MFHRHLQPQDSHHPPRNIDRCYFYTDNKLQSLTQYYNELRAAPSKYSLVVGNPDQDPKPYVGYPRGGWVFTDLLNVSPLWVSKTGKSWENRGNVKIQWISLSGVATSPHSMAIFQIVNFFTVLVSRIKKFINFFRTTRVVPENQLESNTARTLILGPLRRPKSPKFSKQVTK